MPPAKIEEMEDIGNESDSSVHTEDLSGSSSDECESGDEIESPTASADKSVFYKYNTPTPIEDGSKRFSVVEPAATEPHTGKQDPQMPLPKTIQGYAILRDLGEDLKEVHYVNALHYHDKGSGLHRYYIIWNQNDHVRVRNALAFSAPKEGGNKGRGSNRGKPSTSLLASISLALHDPPNKHSKFDPEILKHPVLTNYRNSDGVVTHIFNTRYAAKLLKNAEQQAAKAAQRAAKRAKAKEAETKEEAAKESAKPVAKSPKKKKKPKCVLSDETIVDENESTPVPLSPSKTGTTPKKPPAVVRPSRQLTLEVPSASKKRSRDTDSQPATKKVRLTTKTPMFKQMVPLLQSMIDMMGVEIE